MDYHFYTEEPINPEHVKLAMHIPYEEESTEVDKKKWSEICADDGEVIMWRKKLTSNKSWKNVHG